MSRSTLLALALAAAAPAQTLHLVSPLGYDLKEGEGLNAFPFSGFAKQSYQQIHDDLGGRPRMLTEMAFRPEGGKAGSARSLTLTLSLSNTPLKAGGAQTLFAGNHGPDRTDLITSGTVNWPASAPFGKPEPFHWVLPFPRPFPFTNQGSLCWEIRVHACTQLAYEYLDGARAPWVYTVLGKGCKAAGQQYAASHNAQIPQLLGPGGWEFLFVTRYLAAAQAGLHLLAPPATGWAGLPLPIDLTPFGAPGCALEVAPLLFLGGVTDGSGILSHNPRVPYAVELVGAKICSQGLSLDPGGPPLLPLVASTGWRTDVPDAFFPVCRVYVAGADAAATGRVETSFGLVVRFGYL